MEAPLFPHHVGVGVPFNNMTGFSGHDEEVKPYIRTVRPQPTRSKTKRDITGETGISPVHHNKGKKKKNKTRKSPSSSSSDDDKVPSPTNSLESFEQGEEKSKNFLKSMGFLESEIALAVSNLKSKNKIVTTENLLDEVYIVQDQLISLPILDSAQSSQGPLQTDGSATVPAHSEEEDNCDDCLSDTSEEDSRDDRYRRALIEEKEKITQKIEELTLTCKMCHENSATILLLPCGHLVCCENCLMDVRRCPISRCNKIVRGTKEVYFS